LEFDLSKILFFAAAFCIGIRKDKLKKLNLILFLRCSSPRTNSRKYNMDNLQKCFEEFEKEFNQERKDWEDYINSIYDPAKTKKVKRFLLSAGKVSLETMCSPEMRDFLFVNNGQDMLLRKDEPSMIRKEHYNEKQLFCSYYFQDIHDLAINESTMNVDILCSRNEIPPALKSALENQGFFADSLIDFETLEFPHYENESYYGAHQESVAKLGKSLDRKNKDIAKEFRKSNTRLYRDVEKFHAVFAAGKRKKGETEFIPVYIGFGTNQPYGLSFDGKLGKSRFMKWRFNSEKSGFERGILEEREISPEEFRKRFSEMTSYDIFWGEDYVLKNLIDENPNQRYETFDNISFDSERFLGFFKIAGKEKDKKLSLITPAFKFSPVSQNDYFSAALNGRALGIPVLRNVNDIFNILNDNLEAYEEFSSLMYDPGYVVKRFGMDESFRAICTKLGGSDFYYTHASNIASDAYFMGTESYERLKISSLIIGNYIKSGKFMELLKATHEAKRIAPL